MLKDGSTAEVDGESLGSGGFAPQKSGWEVFAGTTLSLVISALLGVT